MTKYGNKGRVNVSYLSSTICDKFIILMSKTVVDEIIKQVKTRKYFSFIIDSTPDISKTDQLTIAFSVLCRRARTFTTLRTQSLSVYI